MCLTCSFFSSPCLFLFCFFFFQQKTAYEMRISDWSSDVCSSDLLEAVPVRVADTEPPGIRPLAGHKVEIIGAAFLVVKHIEATERQVEQIGRASCRERVCQYV